MVVEEAKLFNQNTDITIKMGVRVIVKTVSPYAWGDAALLLVVSI